MDNQVVNLNCFNPVNVNLQMLKYKSSSYIYFIKISRFYSKMTLTMTWRKMCFEGLVPETKHILLSINYQSDDRKYSIVYNKIP